MFSKCFKCYQIKQWSSNLIFGNKCFFRKSSMTSLIAKKIPSSFNIVCISSSGETTKLEIPKTTFYNELGCSMRDLRFQHTNMINVRDQKIIIRLQELKAIICTDAIMIIDPSSNDKRASIEIDRFCQDLPQLITGYELYARDLPFEYRAIESLLSYNVLKLSTTLAEFEPDLTKILKSLTDPSKSVVDRSLVHILLQKSTKLNEFGTVVKDFIEVLEEWLEADEDLRDLCISIDERQGFNERSSYDAHIFQQTSKTDNTNVNFDRTINLQDEMELLLESFLKNAEEIRNKVSELTNAIENSNNAILINLDSHRNLLLRLEIQLTIGMFSCTLFSMIGMAFGMNLTSHLEEHAMAFWIATGTMVGGSGLVWLILLRYLDRAPALVKKSLLLSSLVSNPQSNKKELGVSLEEEYKNAKIKQIADIRNVSETQKENICKTNTPLVKRMKYVDSEIDVRISNSTYDRLCSLSEKEKTLRKNR